jgi:hypothetical protein
LDDKKVIQLMDLVEIEEVTAVADGKHDACENESADITQFVTNGHDTVRKILLVLVDLGQWINARYLKRTSGKYPNIGFVDDQNAFGHAQMRQ